MAKGQQRSNREIRKPKQDKRLPKPESPFGKPAAGGNDALRDKARPDSSKQTPERRELRR